MKPGIRRYDLDWLRVLAILGVFTYHSGHFFDEGDWSVKNSMTYPWVGWAMGGCAVWMMPLIFVISGASTFLALGRGHPARFIKERVMRLLVPLVPGILVFGEFQVYLERVFRGQFDGTFFAFLPHSFEGLHLGPNTGNLAWHGMHLWYLEFLFVFTLLLLPLFWWLIGGSGAQMLRWLGDGLAFPGAIALLAVPTIVLQNLQHGMFLGNFVIGGWNLWHYLWFFSAGFLIITHQGIQRRIIQARWLFFVLGLVLMLIPLVRGDQPDQHNDVMVWPCLLAVLGFGMKHLVFSNHFLSYANEAVMPFYVLHQTVLLGIGFFVVPWGIPDLAKYLVITLGSFLVSMILYELGIRRFKMIRLAYGMKPSKGSDKRGQQ